MSTLMLIFAFIFLGVAATDAAEPCGISPAALARFSGIIGDGSHPRAKRSLDRSKPGIHDWPWIVRYDRCTAVVIGKQWLLTAGHCDRYRIQAAQVGATNISYSWVEEVEEWHRHPQHQFGIPGFDIMVVKLQRPLTFNESVSPICIRRQLFPTEPGTKVIIAGWGKEFKGLRNPVDPFVPQLLDKNDLIYDEPRRQAYDSILPIQPRSFCVNLTEDQICCGDEMLGSTPGDSGGPLMTIHDGKFYQQAIVAGGNVYSIPGSPNRIIDHGYYTEVSKYCDWIKEKTQGEVECEE